ncbi:hypothetical protein AC249_AIPGENE17086 [Exaiptasia diaphana]|nr:hypothetical protein AC249_AIPGENE17086 [Exaiptasia diaphana]
MMALEGSTSPALRASDTAYPNGSKQALIDTGLHIQIVVPNKELFKALHFFLVEDLLAVTLFLSGDV